MTETEFIKRECVLWTEDYIFDLIDRGFRPVLVSAEKIEKWVWILDRDSSRECETFRLSGRRRL
jgi:hypothetical protein